MNKKKIPWWKKEAIYQIYPKSFQDTNKDGIGDLQGIIKRLKYIKSIGVGGIWISPFYLSPQIDNGYDISDYKKIDPIYGNMKDFDKLIKKAHSINLKVIIDMVFNHSSIQHNWFIQSKNIKSKYHNYYIWRSPSLQKKPPNNWQSKFGGNAWSFDQKNNKYYLHLWSKQQADFNWENKKLRLELQKIMHFWADRGIDGFRLDVINLVSKIKNFLMIY